MKEKFLDHMDSIYSRWNDVQDRYEYQLQELSKECFAKIKAVLSDSESYKGFDGRFDEKMYIDLLK